MKFGTPLMVGALGFSAAGAAWLIATHPVGAAASAASSVGSPDLAAAAPPAAGVEWFWALNGPVSADVGTDLSVDAQGNVFLAGNHSGLDLDRDGVVEIPSAATAFGGARNPLLIKLGPAPSGDRLTVVWARSPRSPGGAAQTRVAADGRGGAYVSSAFTESLEFEGGPTLRGAGRNDGFVARYDGEGSVLWARVFGGPGNVDAVTALAADGEANLYLAGTGSVGFPLDDRGAEFRASASRAAILVAYHPEGFVRWTRQFGNAVPILFNVRVAPNGHVYVSGELVSAIDFDDDGTPDLPAPKDRDAFVARFDPLGAFLGAWRVPMPTAPAFTSEGDVILAGAMGKPVEERYGPADFDGDGSADIELKGGGPTGAWVARYSPEGQLRWVRSYTLEIPMDLEVRGDFIAMAGFYKGVRDLDEDGEDEPVDRTIDPSIQSEMATMLLSPEDGQPVHAWVAPGRGHDAANAVAFLPDAPSLLVTGFIQLTADFTGDGETGEGWIVCQNLGDLFVAQYRLPERPSEREKLGEIALEVSIGEVDRKVQASLAWSGARGSQIDVFRNGKRIATVANDGSHIDVNPRAGASPPFRYRVCEAGSARCSATKGRRP